MEYNGLITIKKGIISFIITGLALAGGAGIDALIQHLSTSNGIENAPAWLNHIWLLTVPTLTAALRMAQNYLKNRAGKVVA